MDNNIIPLFDDSKLKDEASLWLAKVDRGLTVDEEVKLKLWLKTSNEHRDYFVKLAKQWDVSSVLSQLGDIIPYNYQKTDRSVKQYLIAASMMFVLILGAVFIQTEQSVNESIQSTLFTNTYKTEVGEKSIIHLPDTSILTINTNSVVEVIFTKKQRNLIIKKGELFIDVAHNKERELIVSAGSKSFVAIGTAFNVSYDKQSELELIVTEGKVVVANKDEIKDLQLFDDKSLADSSLNTIGLTAGERVVIPESTKILSENIEIDNVVNQIDSTLSWRKSKLIFRGEPLEQVIAEVNRYSNIKIELEGEEIKNIRIGGRFRTGDINSFISVLNEQFDIQTVKYGDSRIKLKLPNNEEAVNVSS